MVRTAPPISTPWLASESWNVLAVPAKVVEIATQMPEVTECHRVTGEDCFILKVHFEGLEVLDRLLDRFLVCGHTTTSLVQSSPIPARDLPLPDERAGR